MKTSTCNMNNRYIVLIIIFLISTLSHAQLKKGFEPRFNESVNGDFAMIANNMVSVNPIMPYNDEGNNDGINLVYVDIDGNTGIGANTFNSSSAEFKNPVTNLPSTNCLTIKRVLLYWAAADKEPDDNDISSENQPDWDFNDIKLMLPGQTNYVDYEADEVLYRGRDDNGDGTADDHFANDPYVCVKDITTFVNNNLPINGGNAYGVYQVANVECKTGQLVEHDALFNTGVSGGWQIVFVYESPLLIKKNVSIYDGYIHVSSTGLPQYGITIDNFQTVPAPQAVNVKILMGSLEGDRGRVGDRLEIENALNTFVPITTDPVSPIRPLNNFFNSRITIDNNNFLDRIPASENTLGFDAAIFDLSNPNNSIIQNDQTSANFRLTTTIETYGMFLLGLSVDVFEPDLGPIEVLTNAASTPQSPGTIINADFTVENKGNDNAVNVTISSTLPPQIEVNDFAGLLLTLPTGVNATYIGNVLTFTVDDQYVEVGDSPIDVDFDLIIKDECYFLNDNCDDLSFGLEFIATYSGATNPEVQSTNSSSDLDACGVGNDQETIITVIQPTGPIINAPTNETISSCSFNSQTEANTAFTDWLNQFSVGGSCNINGQFDQTYTAPNFCGGSVTVIYEVTDLCTPLASETRIFEIAAPIAISYTAPADETSDACNYNDQNALNTAFNSWVTSQTAAFAIANGCSPSISNDSATASIPVLCDGGITTITWTINDICQTTLTETADFTVTAPTAITYTAPADVTSDACEYTDQNALDTAFNNWVTTQTAAFAIANGCSPVISNNSATASIPVLCDGGVSTVTWMINDLCETFTETAEFRVTAPTAINLPSNETNTVNCIADATETFIIPAVNDACGNPITPSAAVIVESPIILDCEGTRTYTYTYSDCAGNSAEWEYVYTIDLMSFVLPGNTTETVDNIDDATEPTPPPVSDNCGNEIIPSTPVKSETPDCQGSVVYTFTYVDCSGNSADWSYTYTIELAPFSVPPSESSIVECIADATPPAPPSVLDANGDEITPVVTSNEDPACEGDKIYTFTYTDCAGNSGVWEYTYTINITTLPVVPTNASSTVECLTDAVQPIAPEITDVCGNIIIPVATENADPVCEGDKIYTFTYLDCAGNISVYTYTYTIDITSNIIVPDNDGSTVECLANATQPSAPVVTDVCGNEITPEITENEDPDCEGEKIYTFTYTDCTGNEAVYTYRYTIDITTGPTVPANDGSTVQCVADAIQPTPPIITDICGSNIIPVITESADPTCEGEKIYTFTFTDCTGNESVYIYTYTIDLTPFILPANGIQAIDNLEDVEEPTPPNVTDNCGNIITPSAPLKSETPDCQGSVIYTFTYTDCAGNSADWSYSFSIELAPFSVPSNDGSNIECIADAIAPEPPTILDANGDLIVPVMTESPDPACEGNKVFSFTYTDCAGNSGVWEYTYTINLITLPNVPTDAFSSVECLADASQPVSPVVTDFCGNNIVPVITENEDPICGGEKVYTFTYIDCTGNESIYIYTYTIDIVTTPIVPESTGSTVECLANATQPIAPVVTDVCGNEITPVVTENADPICEGEKIFTYTYTDCKGNDSIYIYTYTIDVTSGPLVPANSGSIVECVADATQPNIPVVTDICGNNMSPIITESEDPGCEGEKIYTFTYTDCSGNVSEYIYTYEVKDTTRPVLILPDNVSAECSGDLTPISFGEATAIDNCDPNPIVTFIDETTEGACAGSFSITRTWTAIDACGNSVSANQVISASDITPPEFDQTELPRDIVVACDAIPEADTLTATDNCGDAIVTVEDEKITGTCPNNYNIERSYIATDECGTTTVHLQTIRVQDITPPTFVETLPNINIVVQCDNIPDAEILTATDNCGDAVVSVRDVRTNGDCPNNYNIARTWVATDACGLTTAHTQNIIVQDTTPPEFVETLPTDTTVECNAIPEAQILTATDNCSDATVTVSDIRTNGDCISNYTIARTWEAKDECGLIETHTQIITVVDTTAPVPTSSFESILDVSCADIPEIPELEFIDECSTDVDLVFSETNSFDENIIADYQIVRSWRVSDVCDNEEVYTQTLNVSLDERLNDVNAEDICFDNGVVNLDDFLAEDVYGGTWEIVEGNPVATVTGSIFDPTNLGDAYSPSFNPNTEGIRYVLRYTGFQDGCLNVTDVIMVVDAKCKVLPCGDKDISISTALTPNGDSFNKTFDIEGITLCGYTAEVKIFNRWGAIVYDSKSYTLGSEREGSAFSSDSGFGKWDGTSPKSSIGNNGKLPNGTYYYIIKLVNPISGELELDPITGPVYLGTK